MMRTWLVTAVLLGSVACFDFDNAYGKFCAQGRCDGGSGGGVAGGSGGGVAGGAGGGGGSAGGTGGGGGTAGGSGGGGGTAGGTGGGGGTAGGTGGGTGGGIDAGCDASLCLESTYVTSTPKALWEVDGTAPNDVWIAGRGSFWAHWDGATWTTGNIPLTSYTLWTCAVGQTWVWMGGDDGIFRRLKTGGVWSKQFAGGDGGSDSETTYSLTAVSDTDVWAAGYQHWIAHSDGGYFLEEYTRDQGLMRHVHSAAGSGTAWAVGSFPSSSDAIILKKMPAGDWQAVGITPVAVELESVFAIDDVSVWAVGESGTVLERQADGGWFQHPQFTVKDLNTVWGSKATDVWVAGSSTCNASAGSEVWHWDGVTWNQETPPGLPPSMDIYSLRGFDTTDLFFVGSIDDRVNCYGDQYDAGVVLHYSRH